eukprot:TRINITY_DN4857_c0_g1_i2.p1 TRINITY_DN4857_c0_g1~~TRINITY_DN4857_c0_g1_i2.p1  ORF type:complete len:782 (+),score=171.44 TRINITY_DN4857_c0_g1_i2:86-2431(+)
MLMDGFPPTAERDCGGGVGALADALVLRATTSSTAVLTNALAATAASASVGSANVFKGADGHPLTAGNNQGARFLKRSRSQADIDVSAAGKQFVQFPQTSLPVGPAAPILRHVSTLLQRAAESAEAFETASAAEAARAIAIQADLEAIVATSRAREAALTAELGIANERCDRLADELSHARAEAAEAVSAVATSAAISPSASTSAPTSADGGDGSTSKADGRLAAENSRLRARVTMMSNILGKQQKRLHEYEARFKSLVRRKTEAFSDVPLASSRPHKRHRSTREAVGDNDAASCSRAASSAPSGKDDRVDADGVRVFGVQEGVVPFAAEIESRAQFQQLVQSSHKEGDALDFPPTQLACGLTRANATAETALPTTTAEATRTSEKRLLGAAVLSAALAPPSTGIAAAVAADTTALVSATMPPPLVTSPAQPPRSPRSSRHVDVDAPATPPSSLAAVPGLLVYELPPSRVSKSGGGGVGNGAVGDGAGVGGSREGDGRAVRSASEGRRGGNGRGNAAGNGRGVGGSSARLGVRGGVEGAQEAVQGSTKELGSTVAVTALAAADALAEAASAAVVAAVAASAAASSAGLPLVPAVDPTPASAAPSPLPTAASRPARAVRAQGHDPTTAAAAAVGSGRGSGPPCRCTVRDRNSRMALPAFDCEQCRSFYDATGVIPGGCERTSNAHGVSGGAGADGAVAAQAAAWRHGPKASRHRFEHAPACTPPGFWDLSFPHGSIPDGGAERPTSGGQNAGAALVSASAGPINAGHGGGDGKAAAAARSVK